MEEFSTTPTNSDEILSPSAKPTVAPLHEESQILQQRTAPTGTPNAYQPTTTNLSDDKESTGAGPEMTNAAQAADKRAAQILAMHKSAGANFAKAKVIAIIVASLIVIAALALIFVYR